METPVIAQLKEAAALASEVGVLLDMTANGIRAKKVVLKDGQHYTSDNFTSWGAIERGHNNPLAVAIVMLLKQMEEFAG